MHCVVTKGAEQGSLRVVRANTSFLDLSKVIDGGVAELTLAQTASAVKTQFDQHAADLWLGASFEQGLVNKESAAEAVLGGTVAEL
ncbi:hypothetical protein HDU98_003748, partial [Podochytrium sp. JEL0797]